MVYDPMIEIRKLTILISIINGTKDLQVAIDNAEKLHTASTNSYKKIIKNMNHVLKIIEKDSDNMKSYFSADYQLTQKLITSISSFINQ